MEFILMNKDTKIRKTIHLIRHGQTDFNRMNIIQGSGIDSDLNSYGREQADKFFKQYQHIPYDHIYTSRLKRAIQSIEPFIQAGHKHSSLEEFNEINWGIMEGRVSSIDNYEMYNRMINEWSNGNLDIAVEGGESPNKMFERQSKGLEYIMQKTEEKKILICMHGRAIRSFLCLLTNTPLNEMEKWQHSNLCLYELEFNGSYFDLTKENDIEHL